MTTTAKMRGPLEKRYVEAFNRLFGPSLNGEPSFLRNLRHEAIDCFSSLGFPGKKDEAWKYTSMSAILGAPLTIGDLGHPPGPIRGIDGLDAHVGVFIDGSFSASHSTLASLPTGVMVTGIKDAPQALVEAHLTRQADVSRYPFIALNTAFIRDVAFVHVPDGVTLEKPIHLVHVLTGAAATLAQPRTLVIAGSHAQFRFVETTEVQLPNPSFINSVAEVYVGPGAHVSRFEIQDLPAYISLVSSIDAYQNAGSHFQNNCFTFGGAVVRNNVSMLPDAEGCETFLNGLFVARGRSHVDNHTLVDHAKPNCFSSENYRGILDERATGVFNGKVLVRQDAQQINAYQTNKSIVLTNTARMYAKPELEIYADDVKCSHGATTGQLDEEALFYLRTRGLTLSDARTLLLQAFARDIVDKVPIEPLRNVLDQRLALSLAHPSRA